MTQRILDRKLRVLKSELKMLQSYYNESMELFKEYEQEWLQDFAYFQQRFNEFSENKDDPTEELAPHSFSIVDLDPLLSSPPNEKKLSDLEDLSRRIHPDWAKKVFRKIAMITHPDRTSNPEKDSKLFLRASNSFDSGDYEEVLSIAIELAIPLDIETQVLGKMLEKKINTMKSSISDLEKKIPWLWGESFGLYDIRVPLLKLGLAQQDIAIADEELLNEIVKRETTHGTR